MGPDLSIDSTANKTASGENSERATKKKLTEYLPTCHIIKQTNIKNVP